MYKDTITTVYNDVVWRQGSTDDNVYMLYLQVLWEEEGFFKTHQTENASDVG